MENVGHVLTRSHSVPLALSSVLAPNTQLILCLAIEALQAFIALEALEAFEALEAATLMQNYRAHSNLGAKYHQR